jgi:hypothetical protein
MGDRLDTSLYYFPDEAAVEPGARAPPAVGQEPGFSDHCIRIMALLIISLTFFLLWKTS